MVTFVGHFLDHASDWGLEDVEWGRWEWEPDGKRILRLGGSSEGDQFELTAQELATDSGDFRGTWWYFGRKHEEEDVVLRLYNRKDGFALIGEYFEDGKERRWQFELYPAEIED